VYSSRSQVLRKAVSDTGVPYAFGPDMSVVFVLIGVSMGVGGRGLGEWRSSKLELKLQVDNVVLT
jgi:hypothetical protein